MSIDNNILSNDTEHNFGKEKSILVLFIIIIISVLVLSYVKDSYLDNYFKKSNSSLSQIENSNYLETYDPIKNANEDSNGDGIANWREVVGDTNLNDIDQKPTEISSSTNLTDLVSKDLYAVSKYKEKYKDMNTGSLYSAVLDNYGQLILPKRMIDINLAEDNSREFLKGYGNGMAVMFIATLDNKEFVDLKELKLGGQKFTKTKIFLKNLGEVCRVGRIVENVPASYSELHKDFVYNCELYKSIIESVISGDRDEVRLMLALNSYQKAIESIYKNFNDYSGKLKKDDIFYNAKDYGYIFTNKIN